MKCFTKEYKSIIFDDRDGDYKYLTIRARKSGFVLDDAQERAFGFNKWV